MSSKSCSRCFKWTTSVDVLQDVLSNKVDACEDYIHRADMKLVTEQYHTHRPRWWMVGDTVIVPIWMVEFLKKRKTI